MPVGNFSDTLQFFFVKKSSKENRIFMELILPWGKIKFSEKLLLVIL